MRRAQPASTAAASIAAQKKKISTLNWHRGGKWQGAYSASKFAVRGLSQSVAQELADYGITVNVYSPGVVDTAMWRSIDRAITTRTGAPVGSALAGMVEQIPPAASRRRRTSPGWSRSWPHPTPRM